MADDLVTIPPGQAANPADTGALERNGSVVILRTVASFGIIWFHAHAPGSSIAYGGLPAFMMISVAFAITTSRRGSSWELIASRFRRMMVPWVFWSVVYGAAKLIQLNLVHRALGAEFDWWMVATGTSLHLWYLPLGFVVVAGIGLARRTGRFPVGIRLYAAGCVVALMGIVVCSRYLAGPDAVVPFAQWAFIFPAIGIGAALAAVPPQGPKRLRQVGGVAMVVVVASAVATVMGYGEQLVVPYLCGTGATLLAWYWPVKASPLMIEAGELSFSVYLVHPLVLSALLMLKLMPAPIIGVVVIFIVSMAIGKAMKASCLKQYV